MSNRQLAAVLLALSVFGALIGVLTAAALSATGAGR